MTESRPHLLFVVNWPPFFLSHRLVLAQHARAQGYRVTIATGPGPDIDKIIADGFEHHCFPLDTGRMRPQYDLLTLLGLVRLYLKLKPNIVYHVSNKPILYGTFAARLTGVPHVVNAVSGLGHMFLSSGRARLGVRLFRNLMRHPNMHVILQNREDFDLFVQHQLANPQNMRLIPGSGVDMRVFSPAARDPASAPMVLQTSRMIGDKGVREFIAAARIVMQSHPNVRFILVGGEYVHNPSAIPVTEIAAAVDEGVVEWKGHQDNVLSWLHQASIYCLPSYYREGVPKSLIEAAGCGLPLVTTDNIGCRDVVIDRETGLLVPPRDAQALADAIIFMLDNPAEAAAMGARARDHAVKTFSLEAVLSAIMATCAEEAR